MSRDKASGPIRPAGQGSPELGDKWMLITVTSGSGAALRMYVWRKLRSLGALYLQSSVAVLPARPAVVRQVARLQQRVYAGGGAARVLRLRWLDADDEVGLRQDMNQARDGEYAEVVERVPAFLDEIASERAKGRTTYAEVEESEADLARFRAWLSRIESRDYFGAPGAVAARDAVTRCEDEFAAFEREALDAEQPLPRPSHPRLLRAGDPSSPESRPGGPVLDAEVLP